MSRPKTDSQETIIDAKRWLELYGDILFGYSLKYVRDSMTAEDLVQETLLAGLKAQGSFESRSTEQTWLIGILKNKIMDHFRKSKREISFDTVDSFSDKMDEDYVETGPAAGAWKPTSRPAKWMIDSSDPLEQKEFWYHLDCCIEALDKRLAIVFVLREMEELDFKKICNTLAISHTNLRVMLYRARKQLRSCLEKNWIAAEPKII